MEEDEYEKLVFQVDFEDDEERSYQFYMSEYKAVLDGDKFTLDCLHNTRYKMKPQNKGALSCAKIAQKALKYL